MSFRIPSNSARPGFPRPSPWQVMVAIKGQFGRFPCILIGLCLQAPSLTNGQTIIHVDQSATTGADTGDSWTDAFIDLQGALDVAEDGDQIWVAEGEYKPDRGTGNRFASFFLQSGTTLLGGFPAGGSGLDDRSIEEHETILTGDIAGNDQIGELQTRFENSFHANPTTRHINHVPWRSPSIGSCGTEGTAYSGNRSGLSCRANLPHDESIPGTTDCVHADSMVIPRCDRRFWPEITRLPAHLDSPSLAHWIETDRRIMSAIGDYCDPIRKSTTRSAIALGVSLPHRRDPANAVHTCCTKTQSSCELPYCPRSAVCSFLKRCGLPKIT